MGATGSSMAQSWLWKPILRALPQRAAIAALAAPPTQLGRSCVKTEDQVQPVVGSGSHLWDIYLENGFQSQIGPVAHFEPNGGLWKGRAQALQRRARSFCREFRDLQVARN